MERTVDYNTERKPLVEPEYGRSIQQMVDHTLTIEDRAERLRAAKTIVKLMKGMQDSHIAEEDLEQKIWNHLAAMSDYQLDIDYPVQIERHDADSLKRDRIPYPQKRIGKRHYGALLEELTRKLAEIDDKDARTELARLVANQMKRSLANWNRDVMDDEKIIDDLMEYIGGKSVVSPESIKLISDFEAISTAVQTGGGKRKKKK